MDKIKTLLDNVKHPEINNSLIELGMIGYVQEKNDKVIVEVKLPMPEIPIKDMLVDLIKEGLNNFDVKVEFSEMNEIEKENFFKLAKENWVL